MTDVQKLSERFSFLVRHQLTAEQLTEVVARNRMNRSLGDKSSCATHDFCDANMLMHEAFLVERDIDVSDEHNLQQDWLIDQWNQAWELSASNEFQPNADLAKAINLLNRSLSFLDVFQSASSIKLVNEIKTFLSEEVPPAEVFTNKKPTHFVGFYCEDFGKQLRGYVDGLPELAYSIESDPSGMWKYNLVLVDNADDDTGGIIAEYGYDSKKHIEHDVDLANDLFNTEIIEL